MAKKVYKVKLDKESKGVSFIDDGVDEKDFVLIVSVVTFFGLIIIGALMILLGMFTGYELPDKFLSIIQSLDNVVMMVIGSVMATKVTSTIVDSRKPKQEESYHDEEI